MIDLRLNSRIEFEPLGSDPSRDLSATSQLAEQGHARPMVGGKDDLGEIVEDDPQPQRVAVPCAAISNSPGAEAAGPGIASAAARGIRSGRSQRSILWRSTLRSRP
jgi:hypothetical protein